MGKYISSDAWPENEKAPTPPSIDSPMPLNEGTNFTSSDCGKVNGLATGPALKPGEGMLAINGSTDLSSCVVGNYDGKVFQIYNSLTSDHYRYEIWVLAQGPAGTGSGSIWLAFGDESGDHGMWTDGTSVCHDALLSCCASRWSFLTPRSPTPSSRTGVPGTTRTWWPVASDASATLNASAEVSVTTRLGAQVVTNSLSLRIGTFRSMIVPSG